ncbi:MAG: nucleoside-binding protein [Gemmatimonadetes bacterium]|nr:nucleoside-binding protein [Gemmatimonadota bacterium]MYG20813.1 nucleoside-binding protein [Gemmatimonadota bacterium]MYJ38058.1 nucleoside-binding protein [Gemmatimonadota bacterium]
MHFQYGSITNPFAETSTGTVVLTLQHASFWRFGDNFFFVDLMEDGVGDGFNDKDAYGEWYSNLSLRKLGGRDLGFGPFADFGIFAGVAFGADANVLQWLPGARIAWNLPGFVFLNTDFMMAVDGTDGLDGGSPPERDSRFGIDINGLFPFDLGSQSFSITGHAEYFVATTDELGNDVPASILAQPQLRWDIGAENGLFVGIEYQYWSNKLGTEVSESVVQALGVWQF